MMYKNNPVDKGTPAYLADNFKNTELGLIRIARNLALKDFDNAQLVDHLRQIILSTPKGDIKIVGKNLYLTCIEFQAVLTINRSSLGIITAKPLVVRQPISGRGQPRNR